VGSAIAAYRVIRARAPANSQKGLFVERVNARRGRIREESGMTPGSACRFAFSMGYNTATGQEGQRVNGGGLDGCAELWRVLALLPSKSAPVASKMSFAAAGCCVGLSIFEEDGLAKTIARIFSARRVCRRLPTGLQTRSWSGGRGGGRHCWAAASAWPIRALRLTAAWNRGGFSRLILSNIDFAADPAQESPRPVSSHVARDQTTPRFVRGSQYVWKKRRVCGVAGPAYR